MAMSTFLFYFPEEISQSKWYKRKLNSGLVYSFVQLVYGHYNGQQITLALELKLRAVIPETEAESREIQGWAFDISKSTPTDSPLLTRPHSF